MNILTSCITVWYGKALQQVVVRVRGVPGDTEDTEERLGTPRTLPTTCLYSYRLLSDTQGD